MWIASVRSIDWPSRPGLSAARQRAELVAWLDLARKLKLNAVVLQVRPTGDAFWPSRYAPWSEWLTGRQGVHPGYDPLAFAVREAHARNLELHAWFNPYRASFGNDPRKLVRDHPARTHPDWVFRYGDSLYYDPGVPAAREFVQRAVLDAVRRYDIDAVHFDDFFYPYPLPGKKLPDRATYRKYGAGFDSIGDWRRHNVDLLVRDMGRRIHRAKPWVWFGISPFGIWRNARSDPRGSDTAGLESYSAIYADSRRWVERGWVDYVVPQLYWQLGYDIADYTTLVRWWSGVVRGTGVRLYVGQAAYRLGTEGPWRRSDELSRHLAVNRRHPEVTGDVYFSAASMRADGAGGVTALVEDHYARPALVPRATGRGGSAPAPPATTAVEADDADGVTVRWRGAERAATSYAVYRFAGRSASACGFADARQLLTTVRRTSGDTQTYLDTTARPGQTYTYHVTALDRFGHESRPGAGQTTE
ncbi:MAG: family 10 glycosylhydrolase [Streptosporangiales bacterium]|nr:family 10 glycosylhydrolase [Streptosporangiales bacterium]